MTQSLFSFSLGIGYLAITSVPALLLSVLSSSAETSLVTPKLARSQTEETSVGSLVQEYPQEYSQNYLQECKDIAITEGLPDTEAEILCNCTLREFQQKYTLDEFKDLNKRSETDSTASDALIEVGELCFEEILFEN